MRVLIFAKDFPSAGAPQDGVFVLRQVQALAERGIETRVVRVVPKAPPFCARWAAYRSIPSRYLYEGVSVRTFRALVPPRMLGAPVVRKQVHGAMLREIVEFRADIVHVHTVVPMSSYAIGLPVPVVVTAHGRDAYEFPWRRPDLERAAREGLANAAAVVCVSDFVVNHVRRLGRLDARMVYNGADHRVFAPGDRTAARRRLGLPLERPIVAYAGRLLRAKGVLDLSAAIGRLRDIDPLLVFAGDGPERGAIEEAGCGLRQRLLGPSSQSQVADLFRAADVVTLPSYREGLPASLCEAMACGRAIVATCVGGIPEIVHDGETGRLVEPGNVPRLADALRSLLIDERRRSKMESAAAALASAKLTWRYNAECYHAIFAEVLRTRVQRQGLAAS